MERASTVATAGGQPYSSRGAALTYGLSIVIPTRNEADGVRPLLERLSEVITQPAEVIFVDDSDDATAYRVRRLVEEREWGLLDVDLIHRPLSRRQGGLGGAVVEGLRRARGDYVCVMDADLQHPPETVEHLLDEALDRGVDLVIASRFGDDASADGLSSPGRRLVSRGCAALTKAVFPRIMRQVQDPMSGFFLLRRDKVDPDVLRPSGFKILLEVIGRYPELTVGHVGYHFSERYAGVSKASFKEGFRFATQLVSLRTTNTRKRAPSPLRRFSYDIHGIMSVESDRRLPELDKFRARGLVGPPSICVRVDDFKSEPGRGELVDLRNAAPRVRYHEQLGRIGFVADVEIGETTTDVVVSKLVADSPHVLYTNVVEPILRWKLVEKGYALIHAACFASDDHAYLVTARTDTGKTTTMLKVLDREDYSFLSDDLLLVDRHGHVFTYPKPLTISAHTVHALNGAELGPIERLCLPLQSRLHSRTGRRLAFLLTSKRLPVASLNAVVQRLVPPPKYHVEQLVPGVLLGREATVKGMFIIERSDEDDVRSISSDEALEILLANCDDAYGFPPYDALERLLHSISEIDLRTEEQAIIRGALEERPTTLVRSSRMGWADYIAEAVSEQIHRHALAIVNGETVPMNGTRDHVTNGRQLDKGR